MKVREASDLEPAFAEMGKRRVEGILVIAGAFMFANSKAVADLAIARRLPSVHGLREGVIAGGLVSLGPDLVVMAEQAAGYVDRDSTRRSVRRSACGTPSRYELDVNVKSAKALGLTIPEVSTLMRLRTA